MEAEYPTSKQRPSKEFDAVEPRGKAGVFKKVAQHGNPGKVEADSVETMSMNSCSSTAGCDEDNQEQNHGFCGRIGSDVVSVSSSHTGRSVRWHAVRNRLYDRHNQELQLSAAYSRFINRRTGPQQQPHQHEIVIITGPPGTGKSSLARIIESEPGVGIRPAWLYGKCEKQFQEREPFGPIVQALTQWLAKIIHGRNNHDIDATATIYRIEQAFLILKENQLSVVALLDLVPAFLKVLRDSKFVHPDDEDQKGHRTTLRRACTTNGASPGAAALSQFLKAFCSTKNPIVLLLDDWQWLDSGSLHIIQTIATMNDLEGLMIIGTCRGDEMSLTDELCVVLRDLEEENVCITEIQVGNLPERVVEQIIQELLNIADNEDISPLAAVTYRATNGNPFLVIQFLRAIAYHGALYFSQMTGGWQWDESFIDNNLSCFDSSAMVEATLRFLVQDSESTKELLKVASCLGTEFDFELLEAASGLRHALLSDGIDMLASRGLFEDAQTSNTYTIRWSHDCFLHAAASLVPEHEKYMFRVEVASRILDCDDLLDKHTFLVATMLYEGAERFLGTKELRLSASALFNLAGNKTARLSSFHEAACYFRKGIDLLPSECWNNDDTYALCIHLYNSCAEMECCLGNHGRVDQVVKVVQMNARSLHDTLQSYETEIYSLCARGDTENAVDVAFRVLEELGAPVPGTVPILRIVRDLWVTRRLLRSWTVDDILKLRPLRQWKKLAAMRIVAMVLPTIMRCKPNHLIFLICRWVRVTLRHGLCPLDALAFGTLGMVLCYPLGSIQEGLRYDEIGYRIFRKFNSPSDLLCRMYVLRYGYVGPWTMSVRECVPRLLIGAQSGLQTGDFEIAFVGMFDYSIDGMLTGFNLNQHCTKMMQIKDQFASLGQQTCMVQLQSVIQLANNLIGNVSDFQVLVGSDFDAHHTIQNAIATENHSQVAFVRLCQLFLAFFVGDYRQALSLGRTLQNSQTPFFSGFVVQYLTFLVGFSEVIASKSSRKIQSILSEKKAIKHLKRLTKRAPDDWIGRSDMITAEALAACGRQEKALRHWRRAISSANEKGFTHEEALSLERTGIALMEWNRPVEAWNYFQHSRKAYAKWGVAEGILRNCKRYMFDSSELALNHHLSTSSTERQSKLRNTGFGDEF
jgi:predicted ATPase